MGVMNREVDKVADNVADMMVEIEVDKVADMMVTVVTNHIKLLEFGLFSQLY